MTGEPNELDQAVRATIAYNLRRLRHARSWSQEMVAHFAKLHPTEVSRLERGLRAPRVQTLVQLSKALRVPVTEFLLPAPGEMEMLWATEPTGSPVTATPARDRLIEQLPTWAKGHAALPAVLDEMAAGRPVDGAGLLAAEVCATLRSLDRQAEMEGTVA